MKKIFFSFLTILLVGGFMGGNVWASKIGEIHSTSHKEWQKFREAQPFQNQVIAISSDKSSAVRTLIIAEPPNYLAWEKLEVLLAPLVSGCEIKEWFVMSGGSVKDIVCTLRKNSDHEVTEYLAKLQIAIYGTVEGTPVVTLPAPKRQMIAHSLDYRFSAHDLYGWLMDGNHEFRNNPISPSFNLQSILSNNLRGVFLNSDRSFVLWVVDRGGSLNNSEGDISRFTTASDLILGAIANKNTVILIGRGRIEPISHLPPLRSETILLLAGSTGKSLAQSYERHDILAGPGIDGVDRAPILLSPQLIDTEMGTLLNVADQLLKNWSMAGTIVYSNFKYPTPKTYPFGDKPVNLVDKKRENFLFNWNTDGVTYHQKINEFDIVTPQRTGSLSIIYGDPLDRPRKLESTAYDYFASSGDASLARVMQYTLIYQIFRQFDISAPEPETSQKYQIIKEEIRKLTHRQLSALLNKIDVKELQQFLHQYWNKQISNLTDSQLPAEFKSKEEFVEFTVINALLLVAILRTANEESEGRVLDALANLIAILRNREKVESDKADILLHAEILANYLSEDIVVRLLETNFIDFKSYGFLQLTNNSDSIWSDLQIPVTNSFAWNKTAIYVESDGKGISASGVGGHNIDAPMIHFKESTSLQKGKITVERDADNQLIVIHSPADRDRVREISRQVGTRKELPEREIESGVELSLKGIKGEKPIPFQNVRAITGKEADFKLYNSLEIRKLDVEQQKVLSELSELKQEAIVLEQQANGGFVLSRTGSPEALHVASITAATDALANGLILSSGGKGAVSVLLKGVPEERAEAMLGFVQSNLKRYPKETVDHVLSLANDRALLVKHPTLVNAKIAHNGIRIDHSAIKVEKVTSGAYRGYSRVEVPVTIQAKTPILLRLFFYIKDLTSEIKTALVNKLSLIFAKNIKGTESIAEINIAIRRQLKDDLERLNVDSLLMRIDRKETGEVHDVIIGNLNNKNDQAS